MKYDVGYIRTKSTEGKKIDKPCIINPLPPVGTKINIEVHVSLNNRNPFRIEAREQYCYMITRDYRDMNGMPYVYEVKEYTQGIDAIFKRSNNMICEQQGKNKRLVFFKPYLIACGYMRAIILDDNKQ